MHWKTSWRYKIEASRHSDWEITEVYVNQGSQERGAEKAGVPTYDGGCQKR